MKRAFIDIASEDANIKKVSSEIVDKLAPLGVDKERLFDIRLCVEEALRNAIVHGNRGDKKKRVKITYNIEESAITVEVEDGGKGFDPRKLPDPASGNNVMKESGRGVYLIKKLMDKVDFNKKGNKIRMEKRLWR